MKTPPFEPVRFLDLPRQDEVAEAAKLIRQVVGTPEAPMPPLKGRIRQTLRRKSASRRRHLRALLVGGAIFVSGGVVGAVVQPILRLREQAKVLQAVESEVPPRGRRPHTSRLPARMSSAAESGAAPEAADETPAMPAVPMLEPSQPAHELPPAPALPRALPAVPMKPEPAQVSPALPAQRQEKAAQSLASTDLRPPRSQGTHRREGVSQVIAMREQPAVARTSPSVAALPPSSLQPPPVPNPTPVPSEDASIVRRLSPITAASANPVPAKPAASPTQPPAGPPPSEQALVASAIRSLRVQRSPAAALASLDQYQARYPKGSMLAETARLRAEALLILGERRAALDELNRAPGMGTAADEESRLVRGELAASAGRWQEALQDFDALVTAWSRGSRGDTLSPKLRARLERALWGRACARSHLANEAGARADLEELLRRFPQGKFAAQAAQRLGEPR